MSYVSRYKKAPHQELKEKWDFYAKKLDEISINVEKLTFDLFSENIRIHNESWQLRKLDKNIYFHVDYLYLLPTSFKKYSIGEFLEIPQLPEKFVIPTPPVLHLTHEEYPSDYFNEPNYGFLKISKERFYSFLKNDSIKENDKNLFQKEIDERKKIIEQAEILKNKIESKWSELESQKNSAKLFLQKLTDSNQVSDITKFLTLVNLKHELPLEFRSETIFQIFKESQTLVIQFKFPDFSKKNIISGFLNSGLPKSIPVSKRKQLIKQCLYSLMIRIGYLSAVFNLHDSYKSIVINAEQDWFDPATGQERNGVIATLLASTEYLSTLNLAQLDPEICFKHLKGISTPSFDVLSPVRPIFELNKEDERFIESKDLSIDEESNLAAMPWEDFEHLVAQLFEWEFAKNGIEVRVTRASRDRGVDAVLFNPDPLLGGKLVLQAKRYTRTVDVSAVRDLYGTVMNEGANRGILITTSSYGPDSYDFAKDKPISLVDGANLLLMLQKHGKKFRIDLEEARKANET